jgi:uncharacterized protein
MMLKIAESDVLRSLERDNPWWDPTDKQPFAEFSHERAYLPAFKELVTNWAVRRSVILMGPRRVGKTVMLQQLVASLINEGFNPNCIMYASMDTPLYSGLSLEQLLDMFVGKFATPQGTQRVVFFDEMQYLKDWEIQLKVLTDRYPETRFVASGSAAAALKLKSQESGAGRFTEYVLPPLTFSEFLDFRGLTDQLITVVRDDAVRRFSTPDIKALNDAFVDYVNFGGYPEAVLNPDVQSNISRYLGRDIVDKVLLRDLPSLYGIQDIQELNRLFTTLAYNTGQEVSPSELAQQSGVDSKTIARYLEYLEAAFLIVRVQRVDDVGKKFQRVRQFKVYLTNPSMRAALFTAVGPDDPAMGGLAETAIVSQWFHSEQLARIHYARWRTGRNEGEVDLVKIDPANLKPQWAYEIKWSDRFADRPGELRGLIEFAKRNPTLRQPVGATTREVQNRESEVDGVRITHFPCALHCYQIGKNVIEGRTP